MIVKKIVQTQESKLYNIINNQNINTDINDINQTQKTIRLKAI